MVQRYNEEGMIPKDKSGGCKNLDYGGKSMCHHPVWFAHISLSYPTTTLMLCRVVEAVILLGSGVWQDCQSFPTRTLHQRIEPHIGQKKQLCPSFHSLHDGALNTPALHTRHSPFSLILTQGETPCVSCRGFFSIWSHAARRGIRFDCHSHFPRRGI